MWLCSKNYEPNIYSCKLLNYKFEIQKEYHYSVRFDWTQFKCYSHIYNFYILRRHVRKPEQQHGSAAFVNSYLIDCKKQGKECSSDRFSTQNLRKISYINVPWRQTELFDLEHWTIPTQIDRFYSREMNNILYLNSLMWQHWLLNVIC